MIQVDGNVVDLEDQLDAMSEAAADLTDAWPKVGEWFKARQTTVFMTANRGEWPMRDPDTKKIGRGPLIRTGELMRAVSSPKPIFASPSTARFGQQGAKGWYGVFHARGNGVPVRNPVPPLTQAEAIEVVEILRDHIMEAGR